MRTERGLLIVSSGGMMEAVLSKELNEAGMQVRRVRTCEEARLVLENLPVPAVLFSDTALADGGWADIMSLATEGEQQIPVIVVSRLADVNLDINALQEGGCDFIVPPFYREDPSYVLAGAAANPMPV